MAVVNPMIHSQSVDSFSKFPGNNFIEIIGCFWLNNSKSQNWIFPKEHQFILLHIFLTHIGKISAWPFGKYIWKNAFRSVFTKTEGNFFGLVCAQRYSRCLSWSGNCTAFLRRVTWLLCFPWVFETSEQVPQGDLVLASVPWTHPGILEQNKAFCFWCCFAEWQLLLARAWDFPEEWKTWLKGTHFLVKLSRK